MTSTKENAVVLECCESEGTLGESSAVKVGDQADEQPLHHLHPSAPATTSRSGAAERRLRTLTSRSVVSSCLGVTPALSRRWVVSNSWKSRHFLTLQIDVDHLLPGVVNRYACLCVCDPAI